MIARAIAWFTEPRVSRANSLWCCLLGIIAGVSM